MQIINIQNRLPRKGVQDTPHSIGSITHLIVHHDAQFRPDAYDDLTRYTQQANFHIRRGEDGLQYHYKISNLGEIYQCRDLKDTLWHCGNYGVNRSSIAICLDGNFEVQTPTEAQLKSLQELLTKLCTKHPEFPADQDDVFYHNEVAKPGHKTACCGTNLKPYVVKFRKTGKLTDRAIIVTTPTIPQVPATPVIKYYRVFDYNGTQVGAYTTKENAQKKLDSLEAGQIKDPGMNIIVQKDKKPTVTVPPFSGLPPIPEAVVPSVPEIPEIPETTQIKPEETVQPPEIVKPPSEEKKDVGETPKISKTSKTSKKLWQYLWNLLVILVTLIRRK